MDKKYSSKLTKKQEAFCRKYLETGNASEAYRKCYDTENMKTKTVWEKACRLKNQDKVRTRIEELTEIQLRKQGISGCDFIDELASAAFMDVRKLFDNNWDLVPPEKLSEDVLNGLERIHISKRKIMGKNDAGEAFVESIVIVDAEERLKAIELLCRFIGTGR